MERCLISVFHKGKRVRKIASLQLNSYKQVLFYALGYKEFDFELHKRLGCTLQVAYNKDTFIVYALNLDGLPTPLPDTFTQKLGKVLDPIPQYNFYSSVIQYFSVVIEEIDISNDLSFIADSIVQHETVRFIPFPNTSIRLTQTLLQHYINEVYPQCNTVKGVLLLINTLGHNNVSDLQHHYTIIRLANGRHTRNIANARTLQELLMKEFSDFYKFETKLLIV